jgi:hypothetical protein
MTENNAFIVLNISLQTAEMRLSAGGFADWQLPEANRARKYPLSFFFNLAIQRSSVVERSAVNRLVVGSNPTAGAKFYVLGVHSSKSVRAFLHWPHG